MQTVTSHTSETWQVSDQPLVLSDVLLPEKHVTIWQRELQPTISRYFETVFDELGQGLRGVYSMECLKQTLTKELPEGEGRAAAIDDIYLLSDMLTCLFDCENVGLRLAPLSKAMCPRFHIDNIPVRLVCTYLGNGTQWLPTEAVNHSVLGHRSKGLSDDESGLYSDPAVIQQLSTFDVGILKGSAWEDDITKAVVHRSCPVEAGTKRVLLALDPM